MSNNINTLYNHFRDPLVDTSRWVTTDLTLVPKPGLLRRIFGDSSHTRLFKVIERLSSYSYTSPHALFVKNVLCIIASGFDKGLKTLRDLNRCRELIPYVQAPELAQELEQFEQRYFTGSFDSAKIKAFVNQVKSLPQLMWAQMPEYALRRVFAYLSFEDLANSIRTCRHWAHHGTLEWRRQQTLEQHIPYLSSFYHRCLADVVANRKWIENLPGRKLDNTKVADLEIIEGRRLIASNHCCMIQNSVTEWLSIDLHGGYKTVSLPQGCQLFLDEGKVYVFGSLEKRKASVHLLSPHGKTLALLYENTKIWPLFQRYYKGVAYFYLHTNRVLSVNLTTGAESTVQLNSRLFKDFYNDRCCDSSAEGDIVVKSVFDPAKAVCLVGSKGYRVLEVTDDVTVLYRRGKIKIYNTRTGNLFIKIHCSGSRAFVADGLLYVLRTHDTLTMFDLLTGEKVTKIQFKDHTKVIPFAKSIYYVQDDELRVLR
ncbi:MAG: F-box protein [Verrucomicrobia bacterium]|nr:F-box protein [Verrucomicrobiota bacterium]MBS0637433.1 F-box protein [Verrucomicrobiota bacterium]